jgi:hypothetical protein
MKSSLEGGSEVARKLGGLSAVTKVVEEDQGPIEVSSELGRGFCVHAQCAYLFLSDRLTFQRCKNGERIQQHGVDWDSFASRGSDSQFLHMAA